MKTSLHIPDAIAERLNKHISVGQLTSKNKIIVDAIVEYLDKIENTVDWSPRFLAWAEGEPEEEGLDIDRSDSSWREIEL